MRALLLSLLFGSVASAATGESIYQQRCALCHPADGTTARGPGLGGVVGRKAASLSKFDFTQALRASKLVWSRATLDTFLADPATMVPGTNMPLPTPDAGERKALIAYLSTMKKPAPANHVAIVPSRTGSVFGDWQKDAPGVQHHVTLSDLPAPYASASDRNPPEVVARPEGRVPTAPRGWKVELLAEGIAGRVLRVAPNGDVFVAETRRNRVWVLRGKEKSLFYSDLEQPFGIAFHPAGDPKWVYVAELNRIVRFPYTVGDTTAHGTPEVIVAELASTTGGHTTRDLVFTPDGKRMLVSIGSSSNVAEDMSARPAAGIAAWEKDHGLGASWDHETWRADVVSFDSEGKDRRSYATGLRNCVGLAMSPVTHEPWCAVNERDALGDDLVPDYVTRVKQGAYYGWPFYYLGDHEEPRLKGRRPDLAGKATVPDVLLQPHSAALGIAFHEQQPFPDAMRGSAFVAFHGSWNRSRRTGYKVVRVPMDPAGHATGVYEDFLTGFVVDDDHVWGRPVGVAVDKTGAVLVSEDGSSTIWRVVYAPRSG